MTEEDIALALGLCPNCLTELVNFEVIAEFVYCSNCGAVHKIELEKQDDL
jgi:uncharacterized Zn finger protein